MTHSQDPSSTIRSETVSTAADLRIDVPSANETPAPVEMDASTERAFRMSRRGLMWLAPITPWLWFVFRSVHPVMEFVAILLPVVILFGVAISFFAAVLRRSLRWLSVLISLVLFFVVAVILPWRPTNGPAPESSFRAATLNAGLYFFSDNDSGYFVNRRDPDLLVGIELTEAHDAEFRGRFPNAHADILSLERQQQNEQGLVPDGDTYRRNGLPSIGIYSKFELQVLEDPIADVFPGGLPGFRVEVASDDGPVIVYALHIPRPIPGEGPYQLTASGHIELVEAITNAVEAETLPVVMLGDFNTVDRGQGYRTLTREMTDGMRHSGWAVPTADRPLPWSLIFARLDHILISDDLCTANALSEDTRFSDHRPLIADVGPCPPQ